jgi:hypothetical protein
MPAPEPTDIIWENRHFTRSSRNKRKLTVLFLILVILSVSGIVMAELDGASKQASNKFPIVECDSFK